MFENLKSVRKESPVFQFSSRLISVQEFMNFISAWNIDVNRSPMYSSAAEFYKTQHVNTILNAIILPGETVLLVYLVGNSIWKVLCGSSTSFIGIVFAWELKKT